MSKIVVLIPHFNNTSGLEQSIASIKETAKVDLMVVDDGSLIKPDLEHLRSIYKHGTLFIEYLPQNQGIEKALNHGLKKIEEMSYEFIGRLDCGDFCKPNKFDKQIQYLNSHPETVLLGTWANIIDEESNFLYVLKHPTAYEDIQKKMYLNNSFVHPTVVFRKKILKEVGYYPEDYHYAEDYAYFFKILKKWKVENYPEALLDYVVAENSISSTKRKQQVKNRIKIIRSNFYFGFYPIYGLLQNTILLFMSRKTTTFLKRSLDKIKKPFY